MAQQLNPYITFEGNCAEAMAFYAQALGCLLYTSRCV